LLRLSLGGKFMEAMEAMVTFLCDSTIVAGLGYLGIGLVLHLVECWNRTAVTVETKALPSKTQLSLPAATATPVEVKATRAEKQTIPVRVSAAD
jgi:hypothetical protein